MRLQTKLLLTLLTGICLVSISSQLVQQRRNSALMTRLESQNLAQEETNQWGWVRNLHQAVSVALLDAMAQGDMDKFSKLLSSQKQVRGLQEITLYNADGVATYSTVANRLRQSLSPDLKPRLLGTSAAYERRSEESFDVFTPLPAETSCRECHNEFKAGQVGGVMAMHFSTATLKEAQAQWGHFVDSLDRSTLATSLVTLVVMIVMLTVLILVSAHLQIARPLGAVVDSLRTGSHQVRAASIAIGDGSTSLSTSANELAASLEETGASLEELSSMTRHNADHASQAAYFRLKSSGL